MYTPSLTVDNVIDALATFIQPFVGTGEIVRGQINRVATPKNPCVILSDLLLVDLETPWDLGEITASAIDMRAPKRIDIQADFYGPDSSDQCAAVKGVLRSGYATSQFPDGIKPLYCTDGMQVDYSNGEQQWQQRYSITVSLQYNPVVGLPQQFADVLTPTIYPPSDLQ